MDIERISKIIPRFCKSRNIVMPENVIEAYTSFFAHKLDDIINSTYTLSLWVCQPIEKEFEELNFLANKYTKENISDFRNFYFENRNEFRTLIYLILYPEKHRELQKKINSTNSFSASSRERAIFRAGNWKYDIKVLKSFLPKKTWDKINHRIINTDKSQEKNFNEIIEELKTKIVEKKLNFNSLYSSEYANFWYIYSKLKNDLINDRKINWNDLSREEEIKINSDLNKEIATKINLLLLIKYSICSKSVRNYSRIEIFELLLDLFMNVNSDKKEIEIKHLKKLWYKKIEYNTKPKLVTGRNIIDWASMNLRDEKWVIVWDDFIRDFEKYAWNRTEISLIDRNAESKTRTLDWVLRNFYDISKTRNRITPRFYWLNHQNEYMFLQKKYRKAWKLNWLGVLFKFVEYYEEEYNINLKNALNNTEINSLKLEKDKYLKHLFNWFFTYRGMLPMNSRQTERHYSDFSEVWDSLWLVSPDFSDELLSDTFVEEIISRVDTIWIQKWYINARDIFTKYSNDEHLEESEMIIFQELLIELREFLSN